jgi:hypothetical protein
MTISEIGDLAKEIPTRVSQIIEIANKGFGLIQRLLRLSALDLNIYYKIVETTAIVCEFWGNLEQVWRYFIVKVQPDEEKLKILDNLKDLTASIYQIVLEEQTSNLREREILTLVQQYFEDLTAQLHLM